MKNVLFIFLAGGLTSFLTSCFTPVNLNFESARMLEKGDVEIQGSVSVYGEKQEIQSLNYGVRAGVGITDRFNMKLRFERIDNSFMFYRNFYDESFAVNFFELDLKFGTRFRNFSYSIPVGVYSGGFYQLDPRLYLSVVNNERFDLTFTPKCHLLIEGGNIVPIPGISMGTGFGNINGNWRIRAEVGIDQFSMSAGASLSFCFK